MLSPAATSPCMGVCVCVYTCIHGHTNNTFLQFSSVPFLYFTLTPSEFVKYCDLLGVSSVLMSCHSLCEQKLDCIWIYVNVRVWFHILSQHSTSPPFSSTYLSLSLRFIRQKAQSQKASDSFTCQMSVCVFSFVSLDFFPFVVLCHSR